MITPPSKIPLWIIDDDENYCIILSEGINRSASFVCENYYTSIKTGLRALRERLIKPEIILLDINMPQSTGIEGIGSIKSAAPGSIIVMLTSSEDINDIRTALQSGASGYISKRTQYDDLLYSLKRLHQDGGRLIDPIIAEQLVLNMPSEESKIINPLTNREKEIIRHIVNHKKIPDISVALQVSTATIHTHLKNIYRKLQIHSVFELLSKVSNEDLKA